MVSYLLDTNIISEPFKLQPNLAVLEKLNTRGDEISIASVTCNKLILVTRNISDYQMFTDIAIENWFEV